MVFFPIGGLKLVINLYIVLRHQFNSSSQLPVNVFLLEGPLQCLMVFIDVEMFSDNRDTWSFLRANKSANASHLLVE